MDAYPFSSFTNIKIGNLGGGNEDIQAITVATYDSAYIRAASLGNKFSLLVFDEIHPPCCTRLSIYCRANGGPL